MMRVLKLEFIYLGYILKIRKKAMSLNHFIKNKIYLKKNRTYKIIKGWKTFQLKSCYEL